MTLSTHLAAVFCVGLIAAGQVLFKSVAMALAGAGTPFHRDVLLLGGTAIAIYGLATVFWILLLQTAPLGRLYPYMALSFVFVALASWLLFQESVSTGYLAGLALIVAGLFVIAAT